MKFQLNKLKVIKIRVYFIFGLSGRQYIIKLTFFTDLYVP